MANPYFQFKRFTVYHDRCSMKVTTDSCLFGAWAAGKVESRKWQVESGEIGSLLDIGTGSGLLALMVAQRNQDLMIDAIELDKEAAEQAIENVDSSLWKDSIGIIQADAKHYSFPRKYDWIISNPPFYENELKSEKIKKNIAHHNAGLMLDDLLKIIKTNLSEDGMFYLLLPFKRNDEIRDLFHKYELAINEIVFVRQSVNHHYFRILLAGSHTKRMPLETTINEISIAGDQQQYTDEFTVLLKEYYLNL